MSMNWPDLAVLELLVAVSECGSLSSAARAVGMAQPNASRSLARLERSLGVILIDRRPGGSRLTVEGAVVVDWARPALDSARELMSAAEALQTQRLSRLKVAASMTVAEYLMPGWLATLKRSDPDLSVTLSVQNSSRVFELIAQGAADVGFVESPRLATGLHRLIVATDRLVVVVAPDHPWASARNGVTPQELASTALVVREPGSGTRNTLDRALKAYGPVPPTMELSSNAAVRLSVAAGAGAAVLSIFAVRPWLESGALVEVPVPGLSLERRMHAVWKGPRMLEGPAGDLVTAAARRERGGRKPGAPK
ncbi:LysR family transcriptional regulator [Paenarthrobacter sp. PH39-S1]|uniref:LysR family transcriptional regulator n=1 Tax=Paenarthrobacter sp. PH39-S1 TaxID=3046204 RepID=UPI0024B93FFA|nr:LysR family transcriptional regulator [Paenarthrobacter sp. PH39-S1]